MDAMVEPPATMQEYEELIGDIIHSLNGYHCKHLSLDGYICMGMQDSHYSPTMTIQDKTNLRKLQHISSINPMIGKKTVEYYLNQRDPTKVAKNPVMGKKTVQYFLNQRDFEEFVKDAARSGQKLRYKETDYF